MKLNKSGVQYFPFSPGIPWKLKYNDVIIPEIAAPILNRTLHNKIINVIAFGGLIESFFSLSIFEYFNRFNTDRILYWSGNKQYLPLLKANGLAKPSPVSEINKSFIKNYPVPLFFDKHDFAYFNCLNNYISVKTINLKRFEHSRDVVFKQIFQNSFVEWSRDYIPKLRFMEDSPEFVSWLKINKFSLNRPYIFIVLDRTELSVHNAKCLRWSANDVKSLAAMLWKNNIPVVVCTSGRTIFYDSSVISVPCSLEYALPLIANAYGVMADQTDFLLMALLLSNAKVCCTELKVNPELSLKYNASFIGADNKLYTRRILTPKNVANFFER
jgi:hypothetical protein